MTRLKSGVMFFTERVKQSLRFWPTVLKRQSTPQAICYLTAVPSFGNTRTKRPSVLTNAFYVHTRPTFEWYIIALILWQHLHKQQLSCRWIYRIECLIAPAFQRRAVVSFWMRNSCERRVEEPDVTTAVAVANREYHAQKQERSGARCPVRYSVCVSITSSNIFVEVFGRFTLQYLRFVCLWLLYV